MPALTFATTSHALKGTKKFVTMWRCSQCKTGMSSSRSEDDEKIFRLIGDLSNPNNETNPVHIYDARPYLSAMGNQIAGKGFENTSYYRNCEI